MKIVQINATCGVGSTGKICVSISKILSQNNIKNEILFCSNMTDYPLGIKCANDKYIKLQALKSRILGNYGFNSAFATNQIISKLEEFKPNIVHLHNIHGHDCNLTMLFKYLKWKRIKVVWTFHDCWAFTGYCTHFTLAKCDKWKTGCENCPQKKQFSWLFDKSNSLYKQKKELFTGLDMTIVTPSQWLADLVKQSFLRDYPVKVINNGIDLSIFKPTKSQFRTEHGIKDNEYMILGVAFGWGVRKGLDVFIELSKQLPTNYKIVLVGTDDNVDKILPKNIISVHRTKNQSELAQIYSAADLFVNPTREDNFPTVNIESIACGTPVITLKTGGSPECIDNTSGQVVECDNIDLLKKEIIQTCYNKTFTEENCVRRSKKFDMNDKFKEYVNLYEKQNSNSICIKFL